MEFGLEDYTDNSAYDKLLNDYTAGIADEARREREAARLVGSDNQRDSSANEQPGKEGLQPLLDGRSPLSNERSESRDGGGSGRKAGKPRQGNSSQQSAPGKQGPQPVNERRSRLNSERGENRRKGSSGPQQAANAAPQVKAVKRDVPAIYGGRTRPVVVKLQGRLDDKYVPPHKRQAQGRAGGGLRNTMEAGKDPIRKEAVAPSIKYAEIDELTKFSIEDRFWWRSEDTSASLARRRLAMLEKTGPPCIIDVPSPFFGAVHRLCSDRGWPLSIYIPKAKFFRKLMSTRTPTPNKPTGRTPEDAKYLQNEYDELRKFVATDLQPKPSLGWPTSGKNVVLGIPCSGKSTKAGHIKKQDADQVPVVQGSAAAVQIPNPISLRVNYPIDAEAVKARYPNLTIAGNDEGSPHSHPLLALDRLLGERFCLEEAKKVDASTGLPSNIVDVGGNAARHAKFNRDYVHSCVPPVLGSDEVKTARWTRNKVPNFCTMHGADCVRSDGPFTSAIFVHSLYYFTPDGVADILSQTKTRTAFVLTHLFDQSTNAKKRYGVSSRSFEATWQNLGAGKVAMDVVGNHTRYEHSNLSWLFLDKAVTKHGTLSWQVRATFGDSVVFEVLYTNSADTVMKYTQALHSTMGGAVHGCPLDLQALVLPGTQIVSLGDVFQFVDCKSRTISVPKAVLRDARKYAIGRTRDPQLYKALVQHVRTLMRHQAPEAEPEELAAICAAVLGDMNTEDGLLQGVLRSTSQFNGKRMMERYNRTLDFVVEPLWRDRVLMFVTSIACMWALRNSRKQDFLSRLTTNAVRVLRTCVPTLPGKRLLGLRNMGDRVVQSIVSWGLSWAVRFYLLLAVIAVPGKVGTYVFKIVRAHYLKRAAGNKRVQWFNQHKDYPDNPPHGNNGPITTALVGYTSKKALGEVHESASYSVNYDREDKAQVNSEVSYDGAPKVPIAVPVGIVFGDRLPRVPIANRSNELRAVVNRGIKNRLEPEKIAFTSLIDWLEEDKNWDFIFGGPKRITKLGVSQKVDFDAWNARFPLKRRNDHTKARESLSVRGLTAEDFKRKSFMKREFDVRNCDVENVTSGLSEYDPRLISGVSDRANVVLGPVIWAFSKKLAECWGNLGDDDYHSICYSGGMTPMDLGHWFKCALRDLGECVYLETDASRFDASFNKECYSIGMLIYRKFLTGSEVFKVLDAQRKTRGSTPHGVDYEVEATRKSGDPNTSTGNSMINALIHVYILTQVCEIATKDFRLIVQGDDILVLIKKGALDGNTTGVTPPMELGSTAGKPANVRELASALEYQSSLFGFESKVKTSTKPWEVEFCSGLFWPDNSANGYCYGVKPGRFMVKCGWSHSPQLLQAWSKLSTKKGREKWHRKRGGFVKGMALSQIEITCHVPIAREIVRRHLALTEPEVAWNLYRDYSWRIRPDRNNVRIGTEVTLDWFCERYGLTATDIKEVVTLINNCNLGEMICHPTIRKMIIRDT